MFKIRIDDISRISTVKSQDITALSTAKINNELYYCKYGNQSQILNELVGSSLATYLNLDTVIYSLGIDQMGKLMVVSKDLKEKGSIYKTADEYCECYKSVFNNPNNRMIFESKYLDNFGGKLKKQLLKLCILDIYMEQYDRHGENVIFKINNDISLAKTFDYEASYDYDMLVNCYSNPFLVVSTNEKGFEKFLNKYPEVYFDLKKLVDLDMYGFLKNIEKKNNIILDDDVCDNYSNTPVVKMLKKFR